MDSKTIPKNISSSMKLGDYLLHSKLITQIQLDEALAAQKTTGKKLGDLFVELGFLTIGQMSSVLSRQMSARSTTTQRKRIGDVLIEAGIISEEQLATALQAQKGKKKKIGQMLVELGYITKDQIAEGISAKLKIPIISCAETKIPKELIALIPKDVIEKNLVVPLEKHNGTLVLAMADPLDFRTIDDIAFKTGMTISPVIAYEWAILKAIENNYEDKADENLFDVVKADIQADKEVEFREEADESEDNMNMDVLYSKSNFPPVVKLVAMLVAEASKARASDVHIEPRDKYVQVRYRVDGEMQNVFKYHKELHPSVVSRVKIISKLDITNRRTPQDGSVHVEFHGKEIDLRISTLPSIYGEQIVIRLLDQSGGITPIDELGMPGNLKDQVTEVFKRPQGAFIVTGPTGSGKTTTLYSCLSQLKSDTRKVITIEDPAEYKLEGISQIQVNEAVGRTFAAVLRSVLRQDPDVVMIGEIRDLETAEIAMKAALTGHLVLSTLHTNSTVATLTRFIDMGIPSYILSSAVSGILAQRLIRRICVFCKVKTEVPDDIAATVKTLGIPELAHYYYGTGCPKCGNSGYSGRIAVYEYLGMTAQFKNALANGASESELFTEARSEGVKFLFDDAWHKVEAGITTVNEVLAKIPMESVSKPKEHKEFRNAPGPESEPEVNIKAPETEANVPPPPRRRRKEEIAETYEPETVIEEALLNGFLHGGKQAEAAAEEEPEVDNSALLNDFLRLV